MSNFDDTSQYDRLAGQPVEPSTHTRELVASTGPHGTDESMEFGPVTFSETGRIRSDYGNSSLIAWFLAIVLLITLAVVFLVVVIPQQDRIEELVRELENARDVSARIQVQMEEAEVQVREAREAQSAMVLEAEAREEELETLQRTVESCGAGSKRKEKSRPKRGSKRRRRRR